MKKPLLLLLLLLFLIPLLSCSDSCSGDKECENKKWLELVRNCAEESADIKNEFSAKEIYGICIEEEWQNYKKHGF